jgi:drug/metabolite transporter (DMT)-like permease
MIGRRQRPLLGVCLMVLMAAGFAGMDTGVRALAGVFPLLLMLWLRYAFQAALMAVWLGLTRGGSFRAAHPRLQALRGALLLVTSAMIVFGLQYMPVPELTSINMLARIEAPGRSAKHRLAFRRRLAGPSSRPAATHAAHTMHG